jgi:putative flippase GtrA
MDQERTGVAIEPAGARPRSARRLGASVVSRSALVGIVATVVDLGALGVLTTLGLSARLASPPALLLGLAAQFMGNKWFAFRDRSSRWAAQGMAFAGVEVVVLVANLLLFDVLVHQLRTPWWIARLVATACVYWLICLPAWSRIFVSEAAS